MSMFEKCVRRSSAPVLALFASFAVGCMAEASAETDDTHALTESRIIGGRPDSGDPAVVAVVAIQGDKQSLCTGEIIEARFVLTASHCVDARALGFTPEKIAIITHPRPRDATANDIHWAKKANVHPGYLPQYGINDIAVVELREPTAIPPLPIHRGALEPYDGARARAIGYGTTKDGDGASAGTKNEAALKISQITRESFLATALPATQCHGDSGGPVLLSIAGKETIIGVGWRTVRNDGLCSEGVLDTRVDSHASWIDLITFDICKSGACN
jgi:secreted trypsin-like serine protease